MAVKLPDTRQAFCTIYMNEQKDRIRVLDSRLAIGEGWTIVYKDLPMVKDPHGRWRVGLQTEKLKAKLMQLHGISKRPYGEKVGAPVRKAGMVDVEYIEGGRLVAKQVRSMTRRAKAVFSSL